MFFNEYRELVTGRLWRVSCTLEIVYVALVFGVCLNGLYLEIHRVLLFSPVINPGNRILVSRQTKLKINWSRDRVSKIIIDRAGRLS